MTSRDGAARCYLDAYVRGPLPSVARVTQIARRLEFLELDQLADGYIRVALDGRETGFDLMTARVADETRDAYARSLAVSGAPADWMLDALSSCETHVLLSCRSGSSDESDAARIVAHALAEASGGWFSDPQTGEVKHYAFVLAGVDGDAVRLVASPHTGYSLALGGHARTVRDFDTAMYDLVVEMTDIPVEHGFKITKHPLPADTFEFALASAASYRRGRSRSDSKVDGLPFAVKMPGFNGGAQTIYELDGNGGMEYLWVALRREADQLLVLWHTVRFRNEDVDIFQWGHLRSTFIDQHVWARSRDAAELCWPESTFALPSVRLQLTEEAQAEARAKAADMGDLEIGQRNALLQLLRGLAQQDQAPRVLVSSQTHAGIRERVTQLASVQAARTLLQGLERCTNRLDLRGWCWQCAMALVISA